MNVNCKVSLTDEERNKMFRKLNDSDSTTRMVTRADVNVFVKQKIEECLKPGVIEAEATPVVIPFDSTQPIKETDNFKPSRGDEPYMFKAKDESLRAIHTRMLDCIEEYERAVWEEMEKNRA